MSEGSSRRASRKLLGAENSATRVALMDATESLMRQEGYGAVTSRRIAEAAGLKHQLIFYYFDSLDDLFLAVFRRGAEQNLESLSAALAEENPLRALWGFIKRGTIFTTEFSALAAHHQVLRSEMALYAEKFRSMQVEALSRHLEAKGLKPKTPPVLLTMLLVSLSSVLVREDGLGISTGHPEAEAYIEACLHEFEATGEAPDPHTAAFHP